MRYRKQPFMILMLGLVLMSGVGQAASAATGAMMKGSTLTALCNSRREGDQFACQSYIAGLIDYHHLIKSLGSAPTVDFCIPKDTSMAKIKDIVLVYIARHTEHQDFIAAPGVAMGLFNAYPCAKARRR